MTKDAKGTEHLPLDALDLPEETIRDRFRWARARGHPQYLWPEVREADWRASLEEIGRVTSTLLSGGRDVPVLGPAPGQTEAFGVAALTSGMGPLLGYWRESGLLEVAEPEARLLALHLAHGRLRSRRMAEETHRALEVLQRDGIQGTVLKGVETARRFFPDPGTRPASDVDLLVDQGSMARAEQAFGAAGYEKLSHWHRRRPASDWIPPGAPRNPRSLYLTHVGNPLNLDLHSTLNRHVLWVATVRFDGSLERWREPWPEIHPAAGVLAQPLLTAFLATHASTALPSLTTVRLVELVLVIREGRRRRVLDWDELLEVLERTGAMRFVLPAFELVERLVPGTVDPAFLVRVRGAASRRARTVVDGLEPASSQRLETTSVGERLMWVRGPLELLRTVGETIAPAAVDSPRAVWRLYVQRFWRLLRGRVSLRASRRE